MKYLTQKLNIVFRLCILSVFFFPHAIISAQSIELRSDFDTFNVGDSFLVKVILDSKGSQINSVGGKISIPQEYFDVVAIETGNSFISLWTEKPEFIKDTNEIIFSGGLVGAYSGSRESVFNFVLQAKKEGVGEISLNTFEAFLNDGNGTALNSVKRIGLDYSVTNNPNIEARTYTTNKDVTIPEVLTLELNQDPSIEENKYFVSFFAIDKDSGIAGYEVEERPWIISLFGIKKVWKNSQTPQVLKYQNWISTIKVRAIDMDGNIKEEKVIKPFQMNSVFLVILLLLTLFIFIFIYKYKKGYNKNIK